MSNKDKLKIVQCCHFCDRDYAEMEHGKRVYTYSEGFIYCPECGCELEIKNLEGV